MVMDPGLLRDSSGWGEKSGVYDSGIKVHFFLQWLIASDYGLVCVIPRCHDAFLIFLDYVCITLDLMI